MLSSKKDRHLDPERRQRQQSSRHAVKWSHDRERPLLLRGLLHAVDEALKYRAIDERGFGKVDHHCARTTSVERFRKSLDEVGRHGDVDLAAQDEPPGPGVAVQQDLSALFQSGPSHWTRRPVFVNSCSCPPYRRR